MGNKRMDKVTVDIEKIMKEIRNTIERNKQFDIPPFEAVFCAENSTVECSQSTKSVDFVSPTITQLRNDVQYLQSNFSIPFYWDLGHGFKAFIKRIVRRLIKCILMNIVSCQNTYNSFVAETSDVIRLVVEEQQNEIQLLKNEINTLKQQNDQLQKHIKKTIDEKDYELEKR